MQGEKICQIILFGGFYIIDSHTLFALFGNVLHFWGLKAMCLVEVSQLVSVCVCFYFVVRDSEDSALKNTLQRTK